MSRISDMSAEPHSDQAPVVTGTVKVKVPEALARRLTELYQPSLDCAKRMLVHRDQGSSKYYHGIPCVVAKSLVAKYQKNPKCRAITKLVIPVCGDRGRQIKLVDGGIRVPALFKKAVLPVLWPRPVQGFVRSVEFFRRKGVWYGVVCYNTLRPALLPATGCVGVDRNSRGNIAVLADLQTGKVLKLGPDPGATKRNMRGRRRRLQKAGKFRLLSKIRRKQRRRMTHENHRVSRTIVDHAAEHCRVVAIEKLADVRACGSKIRGYSERNQWAFAQLETFIRYKAALRGVTVVEVDPAYTSQDCSRCGSRHKADGKVFHCLTCGHKDHRDANAAFNIASRGWRRIGGAGPVLSVAGSGCIGDPQSGKDGQTP